MAALAETVTPGGFLKLDWGAFFAI